MNHCIECGRPLDYSQDNYCEWCEEEDDGKDEDFYIEQRERELEQKAGSCTCGAYCMIDGKFIQRADCCCGAE